jgi:hypothetical protein
MDKNTNDTNIIVEALPDLDWSKTDEALKTLYGFSCSVADEALQWYWSAKEDRKKWSRRLRFLAIVIAAFGALVPLVSFGVSNPNFASSGYVALAIAGTLITLDKLFGFSSTWMRYTVTATEIQTELVRFRMDWARLLSIHGGQPVRCADLEPFLVRSRALIDLVRNKIEAETATWVAEYRSSLAALEKQVADQLKERGPGSLELQVVNAEKAEAGVTVFLDGSAVQTIRTATAVIPDVPAGQHRVEIEAKIGGKERRDDQLVIVEPGKPTTVLLTLKSKS